jgi:hypothetical protein
MVRRTLLGLGFTAAAVVLSSSAADATQHDSSMKVPESVGIMPASEAPTSNGDSPLPILLETGGIVLLAAGGIVVARSWVSPAQAV